MKLYILFYNLFNILLMKKKDSYFRKEFISIKIFNWIFNFYFSFEVKIISKYILNSNSYFKVIVNKEDFYFNYLRN